MADFAINPVTVTPTETFKLGDMLNIARGAQAYRQAEQMNPLQVQQQESVTNSAKLKNMLEHQQNSTRNLLKLLNQEEPLTPVEIENHVVSTMKNAGATPEAIAQATQNLPKSGSDKQLRAFVAKHATNSLSAEAQLDKLFPQAQMLNTGGQQIPVQMGNEAFTGKKPGTPLNVGIANQISPASRETLEIDPTTGNKVVVSRDDAGNIISSRAAPAMPGGGGFNAIPAGETSETASAAKAIQLKSNEAAKGVPNSQFNNNKIIQLADKAFTGAGADVLAKLGGGYAALPWTTDAASNMQVLGHQIAQETANIAQQAGFGTDAARSLGEKMVGTTTWTPEAIKSTARMNRALSTGVTLFNQGVNNAVEKAGNSPFAAREFQNKWSNTENLLPTLTFMDAVRNHDQAAIRAVVDEVGGPKSDGYKQLLKQAGNIDNLVKGK